jgi:hypothetical protein
MFIHWVTDREAQYREQRQGIPTRVRGKGAIEGRAQTGAHGKGQRIEHRGHNPEEAYRGEKRAANEDKTATSREQTRGERSEHSPDSRQQRERSTQSGPAKVPKRREPIQMIHFWWGGILERRESGGGGEGRGVLFWCSFNSTFGSVGDR